MTGTEEAYDKTSSTLQTMILVFLAFLLFTTFFIFIPYYSLANNYELLQNLVFYSDQVNKNIETIKPTLISYPDFIRSQGEINNRSLIYYTELNDSYGKANDIKTLEEQIKNDSHLNSTCVPLPGKVQDWIGCNQLQYITKLKDNFSIIINSSISTKIINNISMIQDSLRRIKDANDKSKPSLIPNEILSRVTQNITSWTNELTALKTSVNTLNLSYSFMDKFINIAQPLIPDLIIPKIDIEKQITSFNERIKELDLPIVGKVPFDLKETLLSFPIIISIGFSFISIQYKKLMELNLKTRDNNDRVLSWLDPIQNFPEKLYAWLIIIVPGLLFIIFNLVILDLGTTNNQYIQGQNSSTEFLITQETKNVLYALDWIALAVLFLSYALIIWTWKRNRHWQSSTRRPPAQRRSPL